METKLDLERQKQAKEYARIRRSLWLVDTSIGAIYAILWLFLGWSVALRDRLSSFTDNPWLLVALYAAVFGGIYTLITLPLGYYRGFVLPHRFGQSNQTFKDWVIDQLKGLAIGAPLGFLLLELLYLALRVTGDMWWLWAAAGMLFFSVLLANLAPILIMPLFNKYIPLGDEHKELADRLLDLARRANTKVRGVFKFDMSKRTKAANAALTGIGNTRRIVLGDTLIKEFSTDEIETVLAHELGHHVNKDIPLGILVETALTVGGLYLASLALNWGVAVFGFDGPADVAALPLFALVMGAYGLITMPLGNAYSRWRERRADAYALRATGNGAAYASALTRMANQNLAEVDPEPWVEFLLYSHPALSKRIAMAKATVSRSEDVV